MSTYFPPLLHNYLRLVVPLKHEDIAAETDSGNERQHLQPEHQAERSYRSVVVKLRREGQSLGDKSGRAAFSARTRPCADLEAASAAKQMWSPLSRLLPNRIRERRHPLPAENADRLVSNSGPQIAALATDRSHRKTRSLSKIERLTLSAADGYQIAAMHHATSGPARANLIVAGAIGVPQRYYRRFAEFAAAAGYSTITLDYRGIGLSAPATLKGVRMDCLDWGRLDLAAAVDAMSSPNVPLYIVAHSYGGHAFGLLPNHERVAGLYAFGTGAGWHGWMPPLERIKVLAMWHALGPLLTKWKGYLSWSLLGMGEDLPLDIYRQWKQWCRYPNYFFGDPSLQHLALGFERVRTPIMAANSIDDRWSPPRSRDAFMVAYWNAALQTLDIDPIDVGLRAIGHMGYFRADAMPLWKSALEWLDAR